MAENSKLKSIFDDLKRKIADKNHYLGKLESDKKVLETTITNYLRKNDILEKDLKYTKEHVQRLTLRTQRGAPYFQILQEFFPKDAPKFIEENHVCKCFQCQKDFNSHA